jgi:LysM repeat protein
MESSTQKRCPQCGTPVAQRADSCLMCGAELREQKGRSARLSFPVRRSENLLLPMAILAAVAIVLFWKPWESENPLVLARPLATSSTTPSPVATYAVASTATPLWSPTPPPTSTLPPNHARHTVRAGETVTSIAKLYGTTAKAILDANGLRESSIIHIDDELIVPLPLANTATPTPTSSPSPTPFEYTVRTADTLSEIARKFGTTVEALMEANGIETASGLRAGSRIIIVQPPDYSATMAYETHQVQAGETLISISVEYGVTVAELKEANDLKNDALRAGQDLRIPVGTATPTASPTRTPTLTPTPAPPYPAPALLGPADGAVFEGSDAAILLNWASVGILEPDEWYVVRLRRSGVAFGQLPFVWTKATAWRVTDDLHVAGQGETQRFHWQVAIMRRVGVAEDGSWVGDQISQTSETRTFSWQ